jgi:hypothetical protein
MRLALWGRERRDQAATQCRSETMSTKPTHTAYTVREGKEQGKGFWVSIGSVWTNQDGSLSVTLDALPVNGRLVIRARKEGEAE